MIKARIDLAFHPGAAEEYIAAYSWYCERGIHLGTAFESEIERAVRLIFEFPKRWPVYEKKFRRLMARRFPYSLIYEIRENVPVILAIAHERRKPGYWKRRAGCQRPR